MPTTQVCQLVYDEVVLDGAFAIQAFVRANVDLTPDLTVALKRHSHEIDLVIHDRSEDHRVRIIAPWELLPHLDTALAALDVAGRKAGVNSIGLAGEFIPADVARCENCDAPLAPRQVCFCSKRCAYTHAGREDELDDAMHGDDEGATS